MKSAPTQAAHGLAYLYPGWFALNMGLGGLTLAWWRLAHGEGRPAWLESGATLLAVIGATLFVALLVGSSWRCLSYPEAWAEDRRHPVRRTFIATLPVAALINAAVGIHMLGSHPWLEALWWAGSLGQLFITAWTLRVWLEPTPSSSLWAGVTPALFIPVVGNVLAPLGGVPLGHVDWAWAQLGVGLLFWPPLTALLLTRIAAAGPWPERLRPANYIFLAPPAVVGLALAQLGAPSALLWVCWGMASLTFLWLLPQTPRLWALPFSLPHWGLSFPLAAFASLNLRMAELDERLFWPAVMSWLLASGVVAGLLWKTALGLMRRELLVPEPVPAPAPSSKN